MAEYALIGSGVVHQVIVAEASFIIGSGDAAKSQHKRPGGTWKRTPYNAASKKGKVGIGYTHAAGKFYRSPMNGEGDDPIEIKDA